MIGLVHLVALAVQAPPQITLTPVRPPVPQSRPKYEVDCELRDLTFEKPRRLILSQYGGRYDPAAAGGIGARGLTYIRVTRDDLGIFKSEELDQTGSRMTDWYEDGPIELTTRGGSLTLMKSAAAQAWSNSPTTIGVTAKAGRLRVLPGGAPEVTEWNLIGKCNVSWVEQELAQPANESGSDQ